MRKWYSRPKCPPQSVQCRHIQRLSAPVGVRRVRRSLEAALPQMDLGSLIQETDTGGIAGKEQPPPLADQPDVYRAIGGQVAVGCQTDAGQIIRARSQITEKNVVLVALDISGRTGVDTVADNAPVRHLNNAIAVIIHQVRLVRDQQYQPRAGRSPSGCP